MRLEPAVPAAVLAAVRAPFLDHGASLLDPAVMQPLTLKLDLAFSHAEADLDLFLYDPQGDKVDSSTSTS